MALQTLRWKIQTAAVAAAMGISYCPVSLVAEDEAPRATKLVGQPTSATPRPASKTAQPGVLNAIASQIVGPGTPTTQPITQVKMFQPSSQGLGGATGTGAGPSASGLQPQQQSPQNSPSTPTSLSGSTATAGTASNTASITQAAATTSGTGTNVALNSANTAGAQTTGDILKNVSSVSTKRTSAINIDPRIRGFMSSQVGASANGITQMKTRVDIDSLFSNIDIGIVKNIQVVDGPYDSRFGPGFAFLIADLFPAERYLCGPEMHGSSVIDVGTNGRGIYARQNLKGGNDLWGFYSSYGNRTGTGYSPGDKTSEFQVPADYHVWDGYFALGVDLSAKSRLEFNYIRSERNTVELPGVIYDIVQQKDEQFNVRFVMQDEKDGPENAVVQYWSSFTPYSGNSLRTSKHQTFYDSFITANYFGLTGNLAPLNISNTFGVGYLQTEGLRAAGTLGEKDSAQLTFGGDWRRYVQSYQETHVDGTGAAVTDVFGRVPPFGIPRSTMEDAGLFTHIEIPSCDDWTTWKFGGRLDFTNAFVNATSGDPVTANNPTAFGLEGKPNNHLYMIYADNKTRLTDSNLYLTTGAAYAMRQANLAELYTDNAFVPLVQKGNSAALGNSTLKPEGNFQLDIGVVGNWGDEQEWGKSGRVAAGVRGFHSTISNYILYKPYDFTTAQTGITGKQTDAFASRSYQYTNLDRALLYGADAFATYKVSNWISLNGKLAWVEGINEAPNWSLVTANPKSSEPLPNIYPINGTISILIAEPEKQKYGFEFITRVVAEQSSVANSLFELQTPGYTVCDARVFWLIKEAQDGHGASIRMTGALENMFDRTYYDHGSLVVVDTAGAPSFVKAPGMNLRLGLQVDY